MTADLWFYIGGSALIVYYINVAMSAVIANRAATQKRLDAIEARTVTREELDEKFSHLKKELTALLTTLLDRRHRE
jgi:hypothetical protein